MGFSEQCHDLGQLCPSLLFGYLGFSRVLLIIGPRALLGLLE